MTLPVRSCVSLRSSLTQFLLDLPAAEELKVAVLIEEVLVDGDTTEEPDVAVVGDGPGSLARGVEEGALRLGLARRHDERDAEETQQVLAEKQRAPSQNKSEGHFFPALENKTV